jgi:hypothetical protein
VGWEKRKRGVGPYNYCSVRKRSCVRKEYVGAGMLGTIAAQLDEYQRRQRKEEATYWKEQKECLQQDVLFVQELEAAVKILTTAHLIGAGYHKHKGQWRRQREQSA